MEQRSRAQKYQQLRQNLAVETENTVKSRDLSRYARQMESFKTPATQEFQYEKMKTQMKAMGSIMRTGNMPKFFQQMPQGPMKNRRF